MEDDDSFTFDLYGFGVREPNSAEIGGGAAELSAYSHTDRQTELSFIYILVVAHHPVLRTGRLAINITNG